MLRRTVTLRSANKERTVLVADLSGPGATVAASDELLVAVDVPAPGLRAGSAYVRLEYRRQMEIAVVGATAVVELDGDGEASGRRVAITASHHDPPRPRGRGDSRRRPGTTIRSRQRRAPRRRRRRRSPTSAPRSGTDGRWPR